MPRLSHALMVAGLLSLGAGAFAQSSPAPARGPSAPHQDATRADLQARLERMFDRLDANHDGKLDAQDRKMRRDQRVEALFEREDTDKNGSISKAEFTAAHEHGQAGQFGPHRAMMFVRGGFEGGRLHGPLPFRPMRGAFMRHDGDKDRSITKSDFVGRGLARFDKADTDHDGKLSPAERDAARGNRDRHERAQTPPSQSNTPPSGQ